MAKKASAPKRGGGGGGKMSKAQAKASNARFASRMTRTADAEAQEDAAPEGGRSK